MAFYDRQHDNKVRTFVLVGDVPPTLSEAELRHVLREQTVGIMRVMCLAPQDGSSSSDKKHEGYALALYESRAAAVEACDAGVAVSVPVEPSKPDSERRDAPLRMTPVQHQQVTKLEATYKPTIEVNGEEVLKSDLAPTKGLQLVLSSSVGVGGPAGEGRGVTARWCRNTEQQQDCPRGTTCKYIHMAKYQKTTRLQQNAAAEADSQPVAAAPGRVADADAVVAPIASAVPLQYRPPVARVPLTRLELLSVALRHGDAPEDADLDEVRAAVAKRVAAAIAEVNAGPNVPPGCDGRVVVRLDAPNGTPIDAPLTSTSDARLPAELKAAFPKPPVFNTPLDRDVYLQKVLGASLDRCRVASATEALDLLEGSARVADAIDAALTRAREAGIAPTDTTTPIAHLAVLPAYDSAPAPFATATVFFSVGDVYASVQRHADLLASVVRPKAEQSTNDSDADSLLPTQRTDLIAKIEERTARWLHRFAVTEKLHLAMAGRKEDRLAVTVALPHLGACVAAWRDGGDLEDTALPTAPVVAISVRGFDAAARENSLMPPAKLPEGEVRWRKTKSVFTQHLPRELREFLSSQEAT